MIHQSFLVSPSTRALNDGYWEDESRRGIPRDADRQEAYVFRSQLSCSGHSEEDPQDISMIIAPEAALIASGGLV
jgi:hypothetical protein